MNIVSKIAFTVVLIIIVSLLVYDFFHGTPLSNGELERMSGKKLAYLRRFQGEWIVIYRTEPMSAEDQKYRGAIRAPWLDPPDTVS